MVAAELDDVEEADEFRREVGQLDVRIAGLCDGEAGLVVRNVPALHGLVARGCLLRQCNQKTLGKIRQIYVDALRPKLVEQVENLVSVVIEWEDKWPRMVSESGQECPTVLKVRVFVGVLPREAQDLAHQGVDEALENLGRLRQKILSWSANKTSAMGPAPMDTGKCRQRGREGPRANRSPTGRVSRGSVSHALHRISSIGVPCTCGQRSGRGGRGGYPHPAGFEDIGIVWTTGVVGVGHVDCSVAGSIEVILGSVAGARCWPNGFFPNMPMGPNEKGVELVAANGRPTVRVRSGDSFGGRPCGDAVRRRSPR